MNRKKTFLLLIILITFTGCIKSNSSGDVYTESISDVPILLSCNASFNADIVTRGAIDAFTQIDKIGIFGLARAKTNIGGSQHAPDPDWTVALNTSNYGATTHGRYWDNLKCSVTSTSTQLNKAIIEVDSGQNHVWYYPISSWYSYDFFGYYPYKGSTASYEDSVCIDFETDGTTDIIWGRSEDKSGEQNGVYAYSARYIRTLQDQVVHMRFVHSLTQFRFHIIPVGSTTGEGVSYTDIKKLAVKEIRMHDMYPTLRMTVANRVKEESVGKVYPYSQEKVDYILKDASGVDIANNPVPFSTKIVDGIEVPETIRVGDCIFAHAYQKEYYISMVLCDVDNNENEYFSEKLMTLSLSNNEVFKPGFIYNIYISASGVTGISLDATLEQWQTADDENLNFEIF